MQSVERYALAALRSRVHGVKRCEDGPVMDQPRPVRISICSLFGWHGKLLQYRLHSIYTVYIVCRAHCDAACLTLSQACQLKLHNSEPLKAGHALRMTML